MINELESIRLSFFNLMLSNPTTFTTAMANTDDIPANELHQAVLGTRDIYQQIVSSKNGASGNYRTIPDTWYYNNIAKLPTPAAQSSQSVIKDTTPIKRTTREHNQTETPPVKKRKGLSDAGDVPTVDLTQAQIDKYKTQGFLKCKSTKCPRIARQISTHDNKEPCKGFVFLDRYCSHTQETCPKAHVTSFNRLQKSDQEWFKNWVQNEKDTSFAEGNGPKKDGN